MKNTCRARDPFNCRFHGHKAYDRAVKHVAYLTASRDGAKNLKDYEAFIDELREAQTVVNATPKGFKLLQKKLSQAERTGDFQEALSTTMLLQTAAQHRIVNDGTAAWEGVEQNLDLFLEKVLTEGKAHPEVNIPMHMTGSSPIGHLVGRIKKTPGHRIVDVELVEDTQLTPEEKTRIKKEILDYVEKYGTDSWYSEVLRPNGVSARGLTYEDVRKNIIQVKGNRYAR